MPTRSETYRVLVASPSDRAEERLAASEAIYEWNAQHALAESTVLLPVKWETHAAPQSGIRPQEALSRQLVQQSDILVGMFWTKLGTDTGVAESGTLEEIDQFVAAGRPALLYFSRRPIDPGKIDLKQHKKLRAFKATTYKKSLVGSFSTVAELRQTLLRDLLHYVREFTRPYLPPSKSSGIKSGGIAIRTGCIGSKRVRSPYLPLRSRFWREPRKRRVASNASMAARRISDGMILNGAC